MSSVTFIPCIAAVGGVSALKSRRARTVVKRTPYGAPALRARVHQVSSARSAVKVQALMDDKDAKKMPTRKEEPDEYVHRTCSHLCMRGGSYEERTAM